MDKDALVQGGVDYDDALARFMGNADLYEKFLLKFPEDQTFPALREAMQNNDAYTAFCQAHTLKGVVGNLSFKTLMAQVVPLVEALRQEDMDRARALFPAVEQEYRHLCGVLCQEQK